jgi:AraC-like DNA-binding protein
MKPQISPRKAGKSTPEFFSADVAEARRFYLDLNPPRTQPLVVVCGGIEHCTPDYAIHRETFPFYSIEYVARGRGEVELQGRKFPLQSGRLFAYGPDVHHRITGVAADPLVKYFVDFVGTEAMVLMRSCGLLPGRVSQVFPANALQPLFEELVEAGHAVSREGGVLCARLLECIGLRIAGARAPLEGAETLAFETYQQCRQHIEKHALRLRTLEQIARECHVNNAYLCRLFRRYDHQSPYRYLLRLKMNHAAERLLQPKAMVKQAAAEAGFADPFHFSRVFTSVFGLSPTAFRGLRDPQQPSRGGVD